MSCKCNCKKEIKVNKKEREMIELALIKQFDRIHADRHYLDYGKRQKLLLEYSLLIQKFQPLTPMDDNREY